MEIPQFTEQDYLDAMNDPAVTAISGWTETNCDVNCDEEAYRHRLDANASVLHEKIDEAIEIVKNGSKFPK